MEKTLVIVPCGLAKIWDKKSASGPTLAKAAYVGAPFKVNREYAEHLSDRWVILSAKYGFIDPDFIIPGPYNVTFKRKSSDLATVDELRGQVHQLGLNSFGRVIGLGGKEYRAMIRAAFDGIPVVLEFPCAGLPIGRAMAAAKMAVRQ